VRICIDASVLLNWVLPQAKSPEFDSSFEGLILKHEACAPQLLFAECTSVLRRYVHQRVISHGEASDSLHRLLDLPVMIVQTRRVHEQALDIAEALGHGKAYDAQYLAAARETGALLVTADGGMHTNARRLSIESLLLA